MEVKETVICDQDHHLLLGPHTLRLSGLPKWTQAHFLFLLHITIRVVISKHTLDSFNHSCFKTLFIVLRGKKSKSLICLMRYAYSDRSDLCLDPLASSGTTSPPSLGDLATVLVLLTSSCPWASAHVHTVISGTPYPL